MPIPPNTGDEIFLYRNITSTIRTSYYASFFLKIKHTSPCRKRFFSRNITGFLTLQIDVNVIYKRNEKNKEIQFNLKIYVNKYRNFLLD